MPQAPQPPLSHLEAPPPRWRGFPLNARRRGHQPRAGVYANVARRRPQRCDTGAAYFSRYGAASWRGGLLALIVSASAVRRCRQPPGRVFAPQEPLGPHANRIAPLLRGSVRLRWCGMASSRLSLAPNLSDALARDAGYFTKDRDKPSWLLSIALCELISECRPNQGVL
jgi:hypothetical protein